MLRRAKLSLASADPAKSFADGDGHLSAPIGNVRPASPAVMTSACARAARSKSFMVSTPFRPPHPNQRGALFARGNRDGGAGFIRNSAAAFAGRV